MKQGKTDIVLVVDRSGSMSTVQQEAENGINSFIKDQKKEPGEAVLTLVQFDTDYEVVHDGLALDSVPDFKLVPRGMTALLDAVGKAINTVGERLNALGKEERPEHVIMVIITDGHENSSHEFKKGQIKDMIQHQQDNYKWSFTFLGADADAFDDAGSIGIMRGTTASYKPQNVGVAYSSLNCAVSRTRSGAGTMDWSDEEREKMAK